MKLWKTVATSCLMAWSVLAAAEPGVTDSSITLGMSAPLSGPNGAYGVEMREVINAYFAQVNKNGGVNGRKLVLEALDDGYETDRTVTNTRTLINDKQAFALLGYYGSSPTTQAMNDVFGPAKVPLVGTISGAETLRRSPGANPNNRYMFNVRASYANETDVIVSQLVSLGLKNIAVFYQNDGYGRSGLDGVTAALKKFDLAPSAVGTVERNSLDVDQAVQNISKVTPQAVVMITLYKPTAAFVRHMKKNGQNPMFMTVSPVGAEQLVAELGDEARGIGISQVMPYPWNDTTPAVRDYQRLLGRSGKYSYYGVEGYITAKVMVEALRRAGRDLTREKLVTTLEAMNNLDLGGYRVTYGPDNHNGSRFVELTVIGSGGKILR
ncbi:ABC transporter substrate-binding protein [Azovibrio restrictus]|uniref:ABC transporter substrate-binding protein n=1 Tax=Azovibrio restrictus TaxID=146938 RepID=UPI0026EFF5A2|nr:ABC transporter substrate-binding protein [Azovibrio restrictus]MDD3482018.1 ABC transporter substrate-binding protein [Azovibrio restrictus]